jgi:TonB family protein
VKLSFTVDSYGTISSIKVVKSVSTATDQKAIDLLRQGVVWVGSNSGKTETVTVRVKFGE